MKRKRTSDGVVRPGRRRRMNARNSESPPSFSLAPRSTQSSTVALESSRLQAMIDTLTGTVAAQNRKLDELSQDNRDLRDRIRNLSQTLHKKNDELVQGNAHLRDEIRNLSQTVQSSKKDMQRVENICNNMASELKGKFENMLEKSENRILGPINRLSEELERIRANPPAPPVPVPSSTAFPSTAPYPPQPPVGDGEWTSRDDYTPSESNKPQYEESWGNNRQPDPKYGRGGFRPYRGRGRGGSRGGYSGSRPPNQRHCYPPNPDGWGQSSWDQAMPFTPAAAPPESAPTPAVPPPSTRTTLKDTHHRRAHTHHHRHHHHTHTHTHTLPHLRPHILVPIHTHTEMQIPCTSTHGPPTSPIQQQQQQLHHHRHLHNQIAIDTLQPIHQSMSTSRTSTSARSSSVPSHPIPSQQHQPPPPRSHEWRQTSASAPAPAQAPAEDEGYTVRSPTPSDRDELVQWTTPTPSDSIAAAAGGQRRHGRHDSQNSRTSSPGRGYAGHGHRQRGGGWR
ncbi:hypothetical protein BGY98DRAFT_981238 [Russula aff. rugulosa BPL654]|nr:hypothetical protein BGY98DRAFT_981238 [Russula aff. rugulosa BPL654]